MQELIDIRRVVFGPENMTALVRLAEDAPTMTSEDLEGTARVYNLLPHIADHVCLGDAGETFRDAMGNTELAHLLEHVTVELLAQTDLAGDMPAGRTWVDEVDDRTYQIELACPDDVLTAAALSCAVWILDWAYRGGEDPEPDIDAIVGGLVQMIDNIGDEGEDFVLDYASEDDEAWDEDEPVEDDEWLDEDEPEAVEADETLVEPEAIPEPAAEVEPELAPEPESEPAQEPQKQERPLWTPAPDVTASMVLPVDEPDELVEAEVDEIMASLNGVSDKEGASAEDAGASDLPESEA